MKNAFLFPGQGSQLVGMGSTLYNHNAKAKVLFESANDILGFRVTDILFNGPEEVLQQTRIAQIAIFLHSVVLAKTTKSFQPAMAAGHSLGEFSALTACRALTFEAGLLLVNTRAQAMQEACEKYPGAMAAIIGLQDQMVKGICYAVGGSLVPAIYNYPGQVVISGTQEEIDAACLALKRAGATKVIPLPVSGAFHSSLMQPASTQVAQAITSTTFQESICPIYQNTNSSPTTDPHVLKHNLTQQLLAPVQWCKTIQHMIMDGASSFVTCGPGNTLEGFVRRIDSTVTAHSL